MMRVSTAATRLWITQAQEAQKAHLPKQAMLIDTPVGEMTLLARGDAICELRLQGGVFPEDTLADTPLLRQAAEELTAYFAGQLRTFTVPLAPLGTAFQSLVWQTLYQTVPYGQTITYGELAKRCDNPRAARAVGMANHVNPLPIFIPCHRVIGHNGKLVGYGGGLETKQWLLTLETAG